MPATVKKGLFIGIVLAVLAFSMGVWIYFLPHRTISRIKSAIERSDADALSHDIDFPMLRSNLKDQLHYLMTTQAVGEMKNSPFYALGVMLGGTLVNNVVDAYVTPYGLSRLLTQKFEPVSEKRAQPDKQTVDRVFASASYGYDSPSRFSVILKAETGERMTLLLTRSGLSWRLTDILLPSDLASSHSSQSNAERIRVEEDIQAIKTQLQLYESTNGFYPTTEQGLQALVTQPQSDPRPPRWYQLFKDLPKDPWGNAYIYRQPGVKNPGSYDLFSAGPDQQADTEDDDSGRGY
jgi:type II secretion system protein G